MRQLGQFAAEGGLRFIKQFDLTAIRQFRQSWADQGVSALKKLERLGAFFGFVHESGWAEQNVAKMLKSPRVKDAPTLPFTHQKMIDMLAACENFSGDRQRLRAFILLMRYSGMRIGDPATCARDQINGRKLFLYSQKQMCPFMSSCQSLSSTR